MTDRDKPQPPAPQPGGAQSGDADASATPLSDEATKKMSEAERDDLLESLGEETARNKATRPVDPDALNTSIHAPGQTAASPAPPGSLSEDSHSAGGAAFAADHEADTAALPDASPLARQPSAAPGKPGTPGTPETPGPPPGGARDIRLESSRPGQYSRTGREYPPEPAAKLPGAPQSGSGPGSGSASASGMRMPAPSTAALPPLTSGESEDDRMFDLRPEEPKPQPELAPAADSQSRRGWLRPIALGLASGLLLGAVLYFAPWPAYFPMPAATVATGELPEIDGQQPPTRWIAAAEVFIGIDATQRPWLRRPATGETLRARRQGPPVEALPTVAIDGFPAIEPVCRLAWIELTPGAVSTATTATATVSTARLHLGSFGFGGAAAEGLPQSIELPPGNYPAPPAIIPDPGDKQGVLIAVANDSGATSVYAAGPGGIAPAPDPVAAGKKIAADPTRSETLATALGEIPGALGAVEIDLNGDGRPDTLVLAADGRPRVRDGKSGPLAPLEITPEPPAIQAPILWIYAGRTLSAHGFTTENLAFTMDIPVTVEYSAREAAQLIRYSR